MKTIGYNKNKRRTQRSHKGNSSPSDSFNLPHLNKQRHHAQQMFDKYVQLARDASSNGDRVQAENCYQHADHFMRMIKEAREGITQIMARQQSQLQASEAEGVSNQENSPVDNGDNVLEASASS